MSVDVGFSVWLLATDYSACSSKTSSFPSHGASGSQREAKALSRTYLWGGNGSSRERILGSVFCFFFYFVRPVNGMALEIQLHSS